VRDRAEDGEGLSEDSTVSYSGFYEPDGIRGGILRPSGERSRDQQVSPVIPARLVSELKLNGGELIEATINSRELNQRIVLQTLEAFVSIDGRDLDDHHDFVRLEELPRAESPRTLAFSTEGGPLAMRILDLFTPLGIGESGLVISEPGSGKTILLQQIANAMQERHPGTEVLVLLLGEKPEEVTDIERSTPGMVVSSSSYQGSRDHLRTAELTLMRAKRLVEAGKDVLVILDSLTELARAYNAEVRDPQRIIDVELSPVAIDRTLDLLDSSVAIEEGGSLTILASLSAGTGIELDDLISEAVRGRGSMEVFLSAELAALRIWPAIDIERSTAGSAGELLDKEALELAEDFRKKLAGGSIEKKLPALHKKMRKYESNGELLKATT
jgi:transcription termination factor Rho